MDPGSPPPYSATRSILSFPAPWIPVKWSVLEETGLLLSCSLFLAQLSFPETSLSSPAPFPVEFCFFSAEIEIQPPLCLSSPFKKSLGLSVLPFLLSFWPCFLPFSQDKVYVQCPFASGTVESPKTPVPPLISFTTPIFCLWVSPTPALKTISKQKWNNDNFI